MPLHEDKDQTEIVHDKDLKKWRRKMPVRTPKIRDAFSRLDNIESRLKGIEKKLNLIAEFIGIKEKK